MGRRTAIRVPVVTARVQWGNDRVFKAGGKMFACSGLERDSRCSFRVDDKRFLEPTDLPGSAPAP